MLILFRENKTYEGIVYKKDCVYDIENKGGFPQRWLKRGCSNVQKDDVGEVLQDPRFPKKKKVVNTGKRNNNNHKKQ